MTSNRLLFTSKPVTEGHPDKVCDRVSDSILDAILAQDPHTRVATETMTTTGLVHVASEMTTGAYVEIPQIIKEEVLAIGYNSSRVGFDGASRDVSVSIDRQSPDTAGDVGRVLEAHENSTRDERGSQGAGDQGIMFGCTYNDTPDLMPASIWLAHRLAKRLARVRHSSEAGGLHPDGKAQVTLAYEGGRPVAIDAVLVSTQHDGTLSSRALTDLMTSKVITPILDECGLELIRVSMSILVNPSGRFVIGGLASDAGLTSRKIIAGTHGGTARHEGGTFSDKDPSRVGRFAAYAARWTAKNVVAAGLASRYELQFIYAIGHAHPVGLYIDIFGTGIVEDHRIANAITEMFDLRPTGMIEDLDLLRPIYREASAYGRFGRGLFPWGTLDRADTLRAAVR